MSVAVAVSHERAAFAALGELFRYPDGSLEARIAAAREELRAGDASDALEEFAREAAAIGVAGLQSVYTSTFDLAPSCAPYLGAHLFGDESRDRARFMVGLRGRYAEAGRHDTAELPDHIAMVLAFTPELEEDEWSDLTRLVLSPALAKMDELLRSTTNPYRRLVHAAHSEILRFAQNGRRNFTGGQV